MVTMVNFKIVLCLVYTIFAITASKYHPKIINLQISGQEIYKISYKALLDLIKIQFDLNDDYEVNDKVNVLETLDLSGNNIQNFARNTFNLPNLRKLILSIDKDDFNGLIGLNELNLSNNELDEVDSLALTSMAQLRKLDLTRNCLTRIDFVAPALNFLSMSDNYIREITSESFIGMPELETIDLSKNKIKVIERNCFKNLRLARLDLSNNQISDLGWTQIPFLKILNLENTFIEIIPTNAFRGSPLLESLLLRNNNLNILETGCFKGLENLRIINLANSKLSSLNENKFKNFSSLFDETNQIEFFDMGYNGIENIDKVAFKNFSKLKKLILNFNKIEDISFLNQIPSLKYLNLEHNLIKFVNFEIFNIKELILKGNLISSVEKIFENLSKLVSIDLSENPLEKFEIRNHIECDRVKFINLTNCKLRSIDPEVLENTFPSLQKISLYGNPWKCACLYDLLEHLDHDDISYKNNIDNHLKFSCIKDSEICSDLEDARFFLLLKKFYD